MVKRAPYFPSAPPRELMSAQGQNAAMGHRVQGVADQVDDHMPQLAFGLVDAYAFCKPSFDSHLLGGDAALKQHLRGLDKIGEVDHGTTGGVAVEIQRVGSDLRHFLQFGFCDSKVAEAHLLVCFGPKQVLAI